MPMTRKKDPVKFCPVCGKQMERKRFNGRLEDLNRFKARRYCGPECAGIASQKADASLAAARKRSVKFRGSRCEICGTTENLQAHHKDMNPWNNTQENIMTLCARCHTKYHWEHGKQLTGKSGKRSMEADGQKNHQMSPA